MGTAWKMKLKLCLLAIFLAAGLSSQEFQHGFSYSAWWHTPYNTDASDSSLALLASIGTQWVAIIVTWYQDNAHSTSIYRDANRTPDDDGLIRAINRAHELGMSVMLKPHVDCQSGEWRGTISFNSESDWQAWFSSYINFITYYADLAEAHGVEEFCFGVEYEATMQREADWRRVIDSVRAHFSGPITYAANHDGYWNVRFWDALDYIGIDAYFPMTNMMDPPIDSLIARWNEIKPDLANLYNTYHKPIIFTEIGYRSVDGANMRPWEWGTSGNVDLQEQWDCYEAVRLSFNNIDWFAGIFWWYWKTDPNQGGPDDIDYTPHNKPAENVVRNWYSSAVSEDQEPSHEPQRVIFSYRNGRPTLYLKGIEAAEASLFDASGRRVAKFELRGRESYTIDQSLRSGVYFVVVRAGAKRFTVPIAVIGE